MEQILPELDDINASTWRRLGLEVFLKRAFVSVLEENIKFVSMDVAAVELDDAVGVFHAAEAVDLLLVWTLVFLRGVPFEIVSIDVRVLERLFSSARQLERSGTVDLTLLRPMEGIVLCGPYNFTMYFSASPSIPCNSLYVMGSSRRCPKCLWSI